MLREKVRKTGNFKNEAAWLVIIIGEIKRRNTIIPAFKLLIIV